MPRRNKRPAFEPLDLTPFDAQKLIASIPKPRPIRSKEERDALREEAAQRQQARIARQESARINGGIDWSVCLIPGCGEALIQSGMLEHFDERQRDHKLALPLCYIHLAVAREQGKRAEGRFWYIEGASLLAERREKMWRDLRKAEQREWRADKEQGQIYFVRQNGLIKAGWSRDLEVRLRAYGPNAEILCHYPGSHADETNLHRNLKPFRAKGREWYEDCKGVQDYVWAMIERHGPPYVRIEWTEPKRSA